MAKTFSLGIVQHDVQQQLALSRKIFDVLPTLIALRDRLADDDDKRKLGEAVDRLFNVGESIVRNASQTGDAIRNFVRAT